MINFIPENYQPVFGSLVTMFVLFGTISLIINVFGTKSQNMALRKLRQDEREANLVSTKPLPDSMINNINISLLNLEQLTMISSDEDYLAVINRLIKNLKFLDSKTYIVPDPSLTNYDIKQEYGPVTLQTYISYEQTYNNYCQKLFELSQFLEKRNLLVKSEFLLNELVNLKSESSAPYIMLCDLYLETKNKSGILTLESTLNKPDYFKNNDIGKAKVLEKIKESLAQLH